MEQANGYENSQLVVQYSCLRIQEGNSAYKQKLTVTNLDA